MRNCCFGRRSRRSRHFDSVCCGRLTSRDWPRRPRGLSSCQKHRSSTGQAAWRTSKEAGRGDRILGSRLRWNESRSTVNGRKRTWIAGGRGSGDAGGGCLDTGGDGCKGLKKRRRDDAKLRMTMEIRGTSRNTQSHSHLGHPHLQHLHHTRGKGKSARGQATGAQCVRECLGGAATRPASGEMASEGQGQCSATRFCDRMNKECRSERRSVVRRGILVLWAGSRDI